ncbi:MAG: tRNA (adenosine(37)-N6)-threonylcarbamoyltransferase complex transferase subunit TsaD [Candidatus Omnitrophota bacterium]
MLVLGVETSCDETAVAIVKNGRKVFSNIVASSLHLHKQYGGVVPEIATRHHVELINFVLDKAIKKARINLPDIDLIACVYGPGLAGALLVGNSLAKALSFSLNVPFIGINHIQAHLYAALMKEEPPEFPFVGLVVSGGHTNLFYVKNYLNWKIIGATRDDAAGETFDKVAKILKLEYPGGPVIEQQAKEGDPHKIRFPRSYLEEKSLDFSFSGLKTAVFYYISGKKTNARLSSSAIPEDVRLNDVAAGFQEAVVDILVEKAYNACILKKVKHLVAGGGVVRNHKLRRSLTNRLKGAGIKVHFPHQDLCQDNAAMVAGLGYQLYKKGIRSQLSLEIQPNLL